MNLQDLVLFRPPSKAEDYAHAGYFATDEVRRKYFDHIWEPCNRATFGRDDILERMAKDTYPIPHEENRDHYFQGRHLEYWTSGLTDALTITAWLGERKGDGKLGRYLDFGSSSGRVVRHFVAQQLALESYGCDLNTRSIGWAQKWIPGAFFFNNTVVPHLPFPDGFFDLVTAYSVFTHIDLLEEAWLLELSRITAPGGTVALSNVGERVWGRLKEGHFMAKVVVEGKPTEDIVITPEVLEGKMPFPRIGFSSVEGVANRVTLFRNNDYIHSAWGRIFQIEEIVERGHLFHELVIMSRR